MSRGDKGLEDEQEDKQGVKISSKVMENSKD